MGNKSIKVTRNYGVRKSTTESKEGMQITHENERKDVLPQMNKRNLVSNLKANACKTKTSAWLVLKMGRKVMLNIKGRCMYIWLNKKKLKIREWRRGKRRRRWGS